MDRVTTLLELIGVGCLVATGFLVSLVVGLGVLGMACILMAWRLST